MKELDKKINMNKEGKVVITRTTEEVLTVQDLQFRIQDLERRKENLVQQSENIKEQYDEVVKEQEEYQRLIDENKATVAKKNEIATLNNNVQ